MCHSLWLFVYPPPDVAHLRFCGQISRVGNFSRAATRILTEQQKKLRWKSHPLWLFTHTPPPRCTPSPLWPNLSSGKFQQSYNRDLQSNRKKRWIYKSQLTSMQRNESLRHIPQTRVRLFSHAIYFSPCDGEYNWHRWQLGIPLEFSVIGCFVGTWVIRPEQSMICRFSCHTGRGITDAAYQMLMLQKGKKS